MHQPTSSHAPHLNHRSPEGILLGSQIAVESIRIMGESMIINNLPEDAASYLADDITFRLKDIIRLSQKFMHHSIRNRLTTSDIDSAMRARNIEPVYGFNSDDVIPLRMTSGVGREVFYKEEPEIDIGKILNSTLPKAPHEISLRAHWLAIEGVQPRIPENPVSHCKEEKEVSEESPSSRSPRVESSYEIIESPALIDLPAELQLYYKEISEACVGINRVRREEALNSLSSDPGLLPLMPRFSVFINEGVKLKLSENKVPTLLSLAKMLRALLDNPTLSLDKYLHELLPSACSCALFNYQATHDSPEIWNLRTESAVIVGRMCKKYNDSVNSIQSRLTRLLFQILSDEATSLGSRFGAVNIISELGPEAVKILLLPHLQIGGEIVKKALDSEDTAALIAANRLQSLIVKTCAPVLVKSREPPDVVEKFELEFGYLGKQVWTEVRGLRPHLHAVNDVNVIVADSPVNNEEVVGEDVLSDYTGFTDEMGYSSLNQTVNSMDT
ncbi:Transcription initiation factor TFIID subunit [Oopsacas minuta]|uniref:Transcription initiation factor TFIID subunit 6 n=1 Tax=Oopsacas minuta TaxID=111878 RepID=A0AAV7K6F1_9METZ|nr:Transcription initiation factor TFIID subunit [Oopsacas minuta]